MNDIYVGMEWEIQPVFLDTGVEIETFVLSDLINKAEKIHKTTASECYECVKNKTGVNFIEIRTKPVKVHRFGAEIKKATSFLLDITKTIAKEYGPVCMMMPQSWGGHNYPKDKFYNKECCHNGIVLCPLIKDQYLIRSKHFNISKHKKYIDHEFVRDDNLLVLSKGYLCINGGVVALSKWRTHISLPYDFKDYDMLLNNYLTIDAVFDYNKNRELYKYLMSYYEKMPKLMKPIPICYSYTGEYVCKIRNLF